MGSTSKSRHSENEMFPEAAVPACIRLIDKLSQFDFIRNFHLVGGTALALQLGHRISEDLDFFSLTEFDPTAWREQMAQVAHVGRLEAKHNDLRGEVNDVKLELIYFAYPPHYPLIEWRGIKMLSPQDIGLFKLMAIWGRNRKKDIVDLYFIDQEVMPLEDLFRNFTEKYSKGDVNLFRQLETLFNDDEIAKSQMPIMLKPFDWDEAYATVKEKLVKVIKSELQL